MNKTEVDYILANTKTNSTIFEWGSGNSTLFFAKHFKSIHSVEHDKHWWNDIGKVLKEENINNVKLLYQPPDTVFKVWDGKHSRLLDNRVKEFSSYIKAIDKFGKKKYDYFIIDGRARVECSEYALRYCKHNSIVYFQEFYRPRYKQSLEWYDLVEMVDHMAVLRPKKECLNFKPSHVLSEVK